MRPHRSRLLLAAPVVALGLAAAVGCAPSPDDEERGPPGDDVRAALLSRTGDVFDRAHLLRPRDDAEELEPYPLAPLLMHELPADSGAAPGIGRLERGVDGRLRVDVSRPTVYFARSEVEVGGDALTRWSYVWWYASAAGPPTRQGVRLTLDGDGFPFLWEVLADSSGARIAFVATETEAGAAERHGAPPPGRAFAVERPLAEAPRTVVAGIVEPGPVPLGPFVYLGHPERDAMAVICRCMPSQVSEVVSGAEYELVEAAAVDAPGIDSAWPEDAPPGARLRLP